MRKKHFQYFHFVQCLLGVISTLQNADTLGEQAKDFFTYLYTNMAFT